MNLRKLYLNLKDLGKVKDISTYEYPKHLDELTLSHLKKEHIDYFFEMPTKLRILRFHKVHKDFGALSLLMKISHLELTHLIFEECFYQSVLGWQFLNLTKALFVHVPNFFILENPHNHRSF